MYGSAFLNSLHEEGSKEEIITFIKQISFEKNIPFHLNVTWTKDDLMRELIRLYEYSLNNPG